MEFEEILLEEIITIVTEAKDEKFMRIDLKRLLNQRLEEYGDTIENNCSGYSENQYDEAVECAYNEGYDDGFNDAREEIQELATNMRKPR